ncbi:MAG: hypothetical protein ACOX6M_14025 [Armatimonadota bacterium]|jgi:hypothetical protein|nr:DUF4139 domain-containing protein [candidate division WS1 bacterium]
MKIRLLMLSSLLLMAAVAAPSQARVKLVLLPQRENVRINFSAGQSLMEEERVVALEEGINEVEMAWEGLPIAPQSILFNPVDGADMLTTLAISTPPSGQSALIWWVRATEAGNYRLRISYALHGGVTVERVDYAARANVDETSVDLTGRARLYNASGMDQDPLTVEMGAALPIFAPIQRDERKDLLILNQVTYSLTKRYVSDRNVENGRVQLVYEWTVPVEAGPQLAGKSRAFLATDEEGQSKLDTFLGESLLPYVARGEEAKTLVGFANNVEVERTLIDARDTDVKFTNVPEGSDRQPERVLWNTRRTWRVDLKNHTPDDLVIRLVEVATGQWSLAGEIQPTEVKNGNVFHIDVPVAAGEEKTIEYTIIQENVEPGDAVLP